VRWQAILSAAAQRRTVLALTPSWSAARCTRTQRGAVTVAFIAESIGLKPAKLEQLCQLPRATTGESRQRPPSAATFPEAQAEGGRGSGVALPG
jgi:hypothetical protein